MQISLIAAISENRVIGKDNKMPWHLVVDLKRFKKLTSNHPIIMGRKTFESIGRALPDRTNIIVTRDATFQREGIKVVHSLKQALDLASTAEGNDEVFVIGGGQIFKETIKSADKLYLTVIHATIEGDVYFPDYKEFTKMVLKEDGEEGELKYTFIDLKR